MTCGLFSFTAMKKAAAKKPAKKDRPLGADATADVALDKLISTLDGKIETPTPPAHLFKSTTASYTAQYEWVSGAIGYRTEDLDPKECPCPAAWELRIWAMKNRDKFYANLANTVGRSDTRTDNRRIGSSEYRTAIIPEIMGVHDEIRRACASYPAEPDGQYRVADTRSVFGGTQ